MKEYSESIIMFLSSICGGIITLNHARNYKKINVISDIAYFSIGAIAFELPIVFLLENNYNLTAGVACICMTHFAFD